jgi:hypothetical protein
MQFKDYEKVEKEHNIGQNLSGFMTLQQGENVIRIVSQFEVLGKHSFQNEKGKWESQICIGKEKGCIYCRALNKVSVKYLGWVIDRKDGQVKLLEIGHTIFKQIGQLQEDPDYAFDTVPAYNVKIRRTGEKLNTEYQVIASPKVSELTAEETEKVSKLKNPEEIVSAMKEKKIKELGVDENQIREEKLKDIPVIEEGSQFPISDDEIDVKDIPF